VAKKLSTHALPRPWLPPLPERIFLQDVYPANFKESWQGEHSKTIPRMPEVIDLITYRNAVALNDQSIFNIKYVSNEPALGKDEVYYYVKENITI